MSASMDRAGEMGGGGTDSPLPTVLRFTFDNATRPDSAALTDAVRRGVTSDAMLVIVERTATSGDMEHAARFTVMASFLSIGSLVLVELRAVETESKRIVAHEALRGVRDSLAQPVSEAARRLARKLAPPE
jgi:hypothetical protein